jgi:hypothetical protein
MNADERSNELDGAHAGDKSERLMRASTMHHVDLVDVSGSGQGVGVAFQKHQPLSHGT